MVLNKIFIEKLFLSTVHLQRQIQSQLSGMLRIKFHQVKQSFAIVNVVGQLIWSGEIHVKHLCGSQELRISLIGSMRVGPSVTKTLG